MAAMATELTSAFPTLAGLEPDAARSLDAAARCVAIPAGTVLFQDGAQCGAYVMVLDGSIRVQKVAENGR